MALINVGASLPAPMWAVVRYLTCAGRPVAAEQARALLCPDPLLDGPGPDRTFDQAVSTLEELGLVERVGGTLRLAEPVATLDVDDLAGFTTALRQAVLADERNIGLATDDSQAGPRDLVRALAWFLTNDPLGDVLGWDEVSGRQAGALVAEAGPAVVNEERWNLFVRWAPALGFAAPPLVGAHRSTQVVPDCTEAVRQAARACGPVGRAMADATETVAEILRELPVLPGGRYSRALGLPVSDVLAPSLSFALLRGHDEGWLALDYRADAPRPVVLTDPDAPGGRRRVSEIAVRGVDHD